MLDSHSIELTAFHYICNNPAILAKVEPKIFEKKEIRILYNLVRKFYIDYSIIPNLKSIDQLKEAIMQDKEVQQLSPTKKVEENIADYLELAKLILEHPIDRYDPNWVKIEADAFIEFRYLNSGMQNLVNWFSKQVPTSQNIKSLVSQAQNMFLTGSSISLHQEEATNFWQASSHIQVQTKDLIDTGWPTLNKFLNGGFERRTLTHLWGAPNVGKSLFLGSIGRNVSLAGKNVFIGSLEMDTRKYAKRMGSSLFETPVSEYANFNELYFHEKLKTIMSRTDDFGQTLVPGALHIQRFTHASPTTITLAADKLAKELGIKWDLVIYDYLGELESEGKNFGMDNMYALHKTNNAELFDHAVIYDWAALTAHQVTADFFDAQDMSMKASAESRGISHRTDNIFGIIQDPMMFSAGKFFLKSLKARDNEFKNWYMRLNIDWKFMNLTDDGFTVRPNEPLML